MGIRGKGMEGNGETKREEGGGKKRGRVGREKEGEGRRRENRDGGSEREREYKTVIKTLFSRHNNVVFFLSCCVYVYCITMLL